VGKEYRGRVKKTVLDDGGKQSATQKVFKCCGGGGGINERTATTHVYVCMCECVTRGCHNPRGIGLVQGN
jgi:hypothetical protein